MLINAEDLRQFEDISTSIKDIRLDTPIKECINYDLKPYLGSAFFYDFMADIEAYNTALEANSSYTATTKQQYALDLLYGKTYTDPKGHSIVYSGLTEALKCFSFCRFISKDSSRYTATGPVIKGTQYSEPLDGKEIARKANSYKSMGNANLVDVTKFLTDHPSEYPLYATNLQNRARRRGSRITAIDITEYY